MKKTCFTLILLVLFSFCKAQDDAVACSTICSHDLLNGPFPFTDYVSDPPINYAAPGGITNPRFRDVQYAAESCIANDGCTQNTND